MHPLIQIKCGFVSDDIRSNDVLPHAKLYENVRRHVQSMRRRRRDLRVRACSGKRENRVVRIIKCMNDEMGGAGMVWIVLEYFLGNGSGGRLSFEFLVASANGSEER